jgi:beta-glucosidase
MNQLAALVTRGGTMQSDPDRRAVEVERQMTDDERFSLLIGVMGALAGINPVHDERIPEGIPMSAGYTPGVPRLGVP